jgi:hypothetical protein
MSETLLDDLLARIQKLPDSKRDQVIQEALEATKHMVWVPNPGPQTTAYQCLADELYYGGQAGGGKSDLGIGCALTQHEQSLILRRFSADADSLAERALQILGSRDGFNGSPPVTIRLPGRHITFGGMKDREDRQRYKGDPKDLMVWDEIPDFLEDQYTFVIGWNRSANPKQRSRVICTGNPPTTPEGLWVIKRWGAWLDPSHPKFGKVKDGQLLWYTTINGKDTEVDGPGPHMIDGEPIIAKSRTFIRAKLSDNPDLSATNYDAVLAAMPERERLAYREGRFDASLKDKTFQIIPSAWARAAQERWTERPPPGVPMCAMFADCTGGGTDPMAIAYRHDGWFGPLHITPGADIPAEFAGRYAAGIVVSQRRDGALIIVDMGGGYGGPLYEHLHMNFDRDNPNREPIVKPFKGSEASVRRTADGTVGFNNKRTEILWKFREALDPGQVGGSPIMLPPDDELFADLTAPSYELRRGLYHAEPKDKVCARLGRSTNKGDAVTGAWSAGPVASTDGAIWDQMRKEMGMVGRKGGNRPKVVMGRHNAKR